MTRIPPPASSPAVATCPSPRRTANASWLPGAELTETLKLRRAQIEAKYAAEIEALYA
jgi:long-subunit acyl-CoA synthetase (AMP-forming)